MDKKDTIKRKIKALLAKTTENGATESEALSAMKKAQELMMEHFISENEITDPYISEKCVFKTIDKVKCSYELDVFYASLCQLFDCKHYFTSKTITFFGFEEDTELCSYFYNFIVKACLNERDRYSKSEEYRKLKFRYEGRLLFVSFVKGFLVGICHKMNEMYDCRKKDLSNEVGLMVIRKEQRVAEQFNVKTKIVKDKNKHYERLAYLNGHEKGKEIQIVQGLNNYQKENTLALEN